MIPKYTGEWNRGSIWRGDTLLGFSMRIADKVTGVPIVPVDICAHIVDSFGRKSGSDMVISWIGVGKLGGGGRVAMGAQFDGYKVTVGSTVHTTSNMTLTVPYQAGTIKVQQMNKLMGAGKAAEVVV